MIVSFCLNHWYPHFIVYSVLQRRTLPARVDSLDTMGGTIHSLKMSTERALPSPPLISFSLYQEGEKTGCQVRVHKSKRPSVQSHKYILYLYLYLYFQRWYQIAQAGHTRSPATTPRHFQMHPL